MKQENQSKARRPIAYIVSMGAGLEAFIYREVEALYASGASVIFFATKFKAGDIFSPKKDWLYYCLPLQQLVIELPIIGCRMLALPGLLLNALRDGGLIDLEFATKFAPIMLREGVRQFHGHFGDHKFFIGYYCKRITGLPLSVTIHAHEFYTNSNPVLFRKALPGADRIFPIAERWCELLKKEYSVPAEKIRLNRLFVDTDIYKPTREIKVLAVGRFTERTGFNYLLEAVSQLPDLDSRLIFVGFGELDLNKMAQELGIAARVTVFNKMDQEQLQVIYQSVDILCVPSITTKNVGAEGIPVVLMEGMACGLPVVATKCGAIDEIVAEYLVDEGSAVQIADAIRKLVLDPKLRKQQGEKNRQRVERHYSLANLHQYECWLDELSEEWLGDE